MPASDTNRWPALPHARLLELRERCLCGGGPWKADLWLLSYGGERAVLKDFSAKSRLVRLLGRAQVAREARVYRALIGLEGVPRLLGRPSEDSLLLEYVDGRRLSKEAGAADAARLAGRLQQLVGAIHERGVAHVDLRGRDNILVDSLRRVWVLDFGASWLRGEGGWLRRRLFGLGSLIDRAAVLKWKLLLAPESVDPQERSRHESFRRLRRLWPLNPKRHPRPHARPR
jgi:predicted Ser/Thr protein kinase